MTVPLLATRQDWQASYNGLDIGAGTPYTLVQGIDGLTSMPDLRTGDQTLFRRHGLIPGDDFLEGRSVTVRIRVSEPDPVEFSTALQALTAAFTPGQDESPMVFQIPGVAGGGTRRIICRPRRMAMPVGENWSLGMAVATIQLDASDPRIYDDTEQAVGTTLAVATGGHAWPQVWNMNWGGAFSNGSVTVENTGAFTTGWTATITGPVTNPSIENVDTGQRLVFAADGGLVLSLGDILVVDSETRTALLGGTQSRYNTIAAPVSWWDLPPGLTQFRFRGTTSDTPTMTISWRSAWIS